MASSPTQITANLAVFRRQIVEWGIKLASADSNSDSQANTIHGQDTKDVIVVCRTRPPFTDEHLKFEAQGPDEDGSPESDSRVEFCSGISVLRTEPGTIVAHVPGMKWNGPTLIHKKFDVDLAFGPSTSNEEVYKRTIEAHDMLELVLSGGVGCVLSYGQTGSGKTYTMEGLEHIIARELFPVADSLSARLCAFQKAGEVQDSKSTFQVSVTFLELLGRHATDLLESTAEDENGNLMRKEVVIAEDKLGEVRPKLIEMVVTTPEELHALITRALTHRRTSATVRNATSSRSHAVLTIHVKNLAMPYSDQGQLVLVDLAGSERYEDSKAHDKQRMNESRDNNASLMYLKECVRAKAKMAVEEEGFVHIPWRMNKLTMILKSIFDVESRQRSKTVVIAHVSPHIQDTAHSINTLGYASPFKMNPPKPHGPAPYDETDPRTWNHERTVEWLTKEFTKLARARRENTYKERQKIASRQNKIIKPLNPDAVVLLPVDIGRLCPDQMVAKNFGTMYLSEFVERCLQASRVKPMDRVQSDEVKRSANAVFATFNHLLLKARTRTRNEILRSRKRLAQAEIYGDAPLQNI